MPKRVRVDDFNMVIEFPDNMANEDISRVIRDKVYAGGTFDAQPDTSAGELLSEPEESGRRKWLRGEEEGRMPFAPTDASDSGIESSLSAPETTPKYMQSAITKPDPDIRSLSNFDQKQLLSALGKKIKSDGIDAINPPDSGMTGFTKDDIAGWLRDMGQTVEDVAMVYPALEAATTFVSGTLGMGVGGLLVAATLARGARDNKIPEASQTASAIMQVSQEILTYKPQTEAGKRLSNTINYPFEKLNEWGQSAGEATRQETESDVAATAVATTIQGFPLLMPLAKIAPRLAESMGTKIQSAWDRASAAWQDRHLPDTIARNKRLVVQSLEETLIKNPDLTVADLVKKSDQYFNEALERRKISDQPVGAAGSAAKEASVDGIDLKLQDAAVQSQSMTPPPQPSPIKGLTCPTFFTGHKGKGMIYYRHECL